MQVAGKTQGYVSYERIYTLRMHIANCSNLEAEIINWTADHTKNGISVFTASLFLLGQLLGITAI